LNITATQRAQDKTAAGDESREVADRQAIEQGEDEGMVVPHDVTPDQHNRKNLDAIAAR